MPRDPSFNGAGGTLVEVLLGLVASAAAVLAALAIGGSAREQGGATGSHAEEDDHDADENADA